MKTMKRLIKEGDQDQYQSKSTINTMTNEQAQLELVRLYCVKDKNKWGLGTIPAYPNIVNAGKSCLISQVDSSSGNATKSQKFISLMYGKTGVQTCTQTEPEKWNCARPKQLECGNSESGKLEGYMPLLSDKMWTALKDFASQKGIELTFNPSLSGYEKITLGNLQSKFGVNIFPRDTLNLEVFTKIGLEGKQQGAINLANVLLTKYGLTANQPKDETLLELGRPYSAFGFPRTKGDDSIQNECVYVDGTKKVPDGFGSESTALDMLTKNPTAKFCKLVIDTMINWKETGTPPNPRVFYKLATYRCYMSNNWEGMDRKLFGKDPRQQLNTIARDTSEKGIANIISSKCETGGSAFGEDKSSNNRFMESKNDSLKNLIRENLIKYSNLKKKDLSEETKIVKGRLNVLTEGKNFQNKSKREELFLEVIQESVYLQNQGFDENVISEGIFDMFSGLFGKTGGEGILQTFKEYLINWMVDKLTPLDSKGWLANIIVTTLSSVDIKDFPKLVSNCSFATARISEGVIEGMIKKLMSDKGIDNSLTGVIRNALFEGMKGTEFVKTMESGISSLICPGMSKISEKLSSKETSMAEKALSN